MRGAAAGPVSFSSAGLQATMNGAAVAICRAYNPNLWNGAFSGPHAGYFPIAAGGPCTFSWGGSAISNPSFDALWLLPAGSNVSAPAARGGATPPPSPTSSPVPSSSPSASSTPAARMAAELWLTPAQAAAQGYASTAFVQSGSGDWYNPVYVCRGLLQAGFSGPTPSASASASPASLVGPAPTPSAAPVALAPLWTATLPGVGNAANAKSQNFVDHLDLVVDAASGRRLLFVALQQNNSVAVVDAAAGTFNASLGPVQGPSGVVAVAAMGLVLVSAFTEGAVYAFASAPPFAQLWRVGGLEKADNLAFDAASQLAWVSAGGASVQGGLYSVNVSSGMRSAGSIPFPAAAGAAPGALSSAPEEFRLSPVSSLIYAASPSTQSIVVVSRAAGSTAAAVQWPLPPLGCSNPQALAVDPVAGRLFVTCFGTAPGAGRLVVLNIFDGALVWSAPTPAAECDQVLVDARTGGVFVVCGGAGAGAWPAGGGSVVYAVQQLGANAYSWMGAQAGLPLSAVTGARTARPAPTTRRVWTFSSSGLSAICVCAGPDETGMAAAVNGAVAIAPATIAAPKAKTRPLRMINLPIAVLVERASGEFTQNQESVERPEPRRFAPPRLPPGSELPRLLEIFLEPLRVFENISNIWGAREGPGLSYGPVFFLRPCFPLSFIKLGTY